MKIVHLKAENIKRIVAVDISPNGSLVQITGKNGQGKTSVLDAIWWCLAGTKNVQAKPIRTGAEEGYVEVDLGEMVATRTFKNTKDGEVTSSLKVESKDGTRFSSPQSVIDKLLGDLTFDPLAFSRMDAKKQFETLRKFVPDVDFEGIDAKNKSDYETRTGINRQAKESLSAADLIDVDIKSSSKLIDDAEIIKQMEVASTHNADIEKRRANRINMKEKAEALQRSANEIVREADEKAKTLLLEAKALLDKLASAGKLPAAIDVSALSKKVAEAKTNNAVVEMRNRKVKLIDASARLMKEAEALTFSIEERNKAKQKAIESAKLPMEGISFGDGEVVLNGQPFNQASDAEQLRASLSIAMALNPKLKVIRVRDGSLLDDDSMKIVEKMAKEKDFQIWIEKVDGSGKVGFVMEEGLIKKPVVNFEE